MLREVVRATRVVGTDFKKTVDVWCDTEQDLNEYDAAQLDVGSLAYVVATKELFVYNRITGAWELA